jgi:hypothetical protein
VHRLLERASELIDTGVLRPTATVVLDDLGQALVGAALQSLDGERVALRS